jgi:hypothetical protein
MSIRLNDQEGTLIAGVVQYKSLREKFLNNPLILDRDSDVSRIAHYIYDIRDGLLVPNNEWSKIAKDFIKWNDTNIKSSKKVIKNGRR